MFKVDKCPDCGSKDIFVSKPGPCGDEARVVCCNCGAITTYSGVFTDLYSDLSV